MDSNNAQKFFSGPNRLEFAEELGRPIRMGAPESLKVSDSELVRSAIASGKIEEANQYIDFLHTINTAVVGTFFEWCTALPATLAAKTTKELERAVTLQACALWREGAQGGADAISLLENYFIPSVLQPEFVAVIREQVASGGESAIEKVLAAPIELYSKLKLQVEELAQPEATGLWNRYLSAMRDIHDLCGQFISAYISSSAELVSQTVAQEVMQEGLESCALLKDMWETFCKLEPAALAAVLAEHLRAHFSGAGRQGSVEIIEEQDRFRLIFDPCGTGGAMRRQAITGLKVFKEAVPATWFRANEVPCYCSHCALNEITSIKLAGYPIWVTEFDPNPQAKCGWTVYKDPSLIPQKYFERLGLTKAPVHQRDR